MNFLQHAGAGENKATNAGPRDLPARNESFVWQGEFTEAPPYLFLLSRLPRLVVGPLLQGGHRDKENKDKELEQGMYELRSLLYEVDAYVYCRSIIFPVNHSHCSGEHVLCSLSFSP